MIQKRCIPRSIAASLAAAALFALPGCYPRQSLSSAPPGATPATQRPAGQPQSAATPDVETRSEDASPAQHAISETTITETPAPAKAAATPEPIRKAAPQTAADSANDWQPVPESAAGAKTTAAKDGQADVYYVQIGAFATVKNANGAVTWLKNKGYDRTRIVVMEGGTTTYHRVQAGPFANYSAALQVLLKLRTDWPQAFIPGD